MNLEELNHFLVNENLWWMWENKDILRIYSRKWDETIDLEMNKLQDISSEELRMCLTNGKNTQQITRVTGYFSIINNWNSGKRGELKERHRTGVVMKNYE